MSAAGFKRICMKCSEEVDDVENHIKICSNEEIRCIDCKCDKLNHANEHDCDQSPEVCVYCDDLIRKNKLAEHIVACKIKCEELIQCKSCSLKYKRIDELTHQTTMCNIVRVICQYCDGEHSNVKGNTVYDCEMSIKCPKCCWFGEKSDLDTHLNTPKKFEVSKNIFVKCEEKFQISTIVAVSDKFIRVLTHGSNASYQLWFKETPDHFGCMA